MKKRIVCLTLALLMSATQVVSVSASREDELREEQAITSQQLDATYSRMDELAYAKSQLENEISELDSNLVSVMVSIDTLKGDIDNKEVDIIKTKQDLAKAQKARDKQYESMKLRIQALYEQGGDAAWFQMMLNSEDLSELLTRAENTQQMYEQDRKNLDKYVNTINEVNNLKTQYESDKAELEEMKASYEQQSYDLQCQIDQKKSESADYENEIAYAQQQATEYANLLAEQTAEIQRLEAERIAAEEEARRQAEEEAARQAAEEEAAAKAAEQEQDSESEEEENVEYDEDGNEIENTDDADDECESDDCVEFDENGDPVDNAGASDDVEYDEYGNVIDSDNTVSPDDYESEQSSDSDSSSSSSSGSGSSVVDFATQFVGNPYVWGGTSLTEGADCSGFVQQIYKNFGYNLPRVAEDQSQYGTKIPVEDAQPGDLIFYAKDGYVHHVVMYAGDGKTIEAANEDQGIISGTVYIPEAVWATRILEENYNLEGTDVNEQNATAEQYGDSIGEYTIDYYCSCETCRAKASKVKATGTPVVEGQTIAVDPDEIPYGTKVIIDGHVFTAEDYDTAGKEKHISIYVNEHETAQKLNEKKAEVHLVK